MKAKEIEIGGVYSNGKDRVRKVVDMVAASSSYWYGRTLVKYIDENDRSSIVLFGTFAQWAKERVE